MCHPNASKIIKWVVLTALVMLLPMPALANPVLTRIADLNQAPGDSDSNPSGFDNGNSEGNFFSAYRPDVGRELFYGSDLYADLRPGPASSDPNFLVRDWPIILVSARLSEAGFGLWLLDQNQAQAPTLIDTGPLRANNSFSYLGIVNNGYAIYDSSDRSVWYVETRFGPPHATSLSAALPLTHDPNIVCEAGAQILIGSKDALNRQVFWWTDGSIAGTVPGVIDPAASPSAQVVGEMQERQCCQGLFATDQGWEYWNVPMGGLTMVYRFKAEQPISMFFYHSMFILSRTDSQGVLRAFDPNLQAPHVVHVFDLDPALNVDPWMIATRDRVLFPAYDRASGETRLYELDYLGTVGLVSTSISTDLWQAPHRQARSDQGGGLLILKNAAGQRVLHTYGGSPAALVAYPSAPIDSNPNLDGSIALSGWGRLALEDEHGRELWTVSAFGGPKAQVADLWPTTADAGLQGATTPMQDQALLYADRSSNGASVWQQDLQQNVLTPRFVNELNGRRVRSAEAADGRVYLIDQSTNPLTQDQRLLRTESPWTQISVLGALNTSYGFGLLPESAGVLVACPGSAGVTLCSATNGGNATLPLLPSFSDATGAFAALGKLPGASVFGGFGLDAGLWRSDGTAPGTFRFSAAVPVTSSGQGALKTEVQLFTNRLWFRGRNSLADNDQHILVTDGSSAGTVPIMSLPSDVSQVRFATVASHLLILVSGSQHQLFVSDGSNTTPTLIYQTAATGGANMIGTEAYAHIVLHTLGQTRALVSDGTALGTQVLADAPGQLADLSLLAMLDQHTIIFACASSTTGTELCARDIDGSQPRLLADLYPGPTGSDPVLLNQSYGYLTLTLDDGSHGREPWSVRGESAWLFRNSFE